MTSLMHIATVPVTLNFFVGQIAYMKEHGFAVEACSSGSQELTDFGIQEEIDVHALNMYRGISPFRDLIAIFKMWRLLKKRKPDIIHTHTPKGGLVGVLGGFLARRPVRLYHIHGFRYETTTGFTRRLLKTIEKLVCTFATHVICDSHSVMQLAIDEGICLKCKISVIGKGSVNGIDLSLFDSETNTDIDGLKQSYNIPTDVPLVGFIGRIVNDKGIVELVDGLH